MTQNKNERAAAAATELGNLLKDTDHPYTEAMLAIADESNLFACYLEEPEELTFVANLGGCDFYADDIVGAAMLDHGVSSCTIFNFFFEGAVQAAFSWLEPSFVAKRQAQGFNPAAEAQRAIEILGLARLLIDSVGTEQLKALDAALMGTVLNKDRCSPVTIVRLAVAFVSYVFETGDVGTDSISNAGLHTRAWVRRLADVHADVTGVDKNNIPPEWGEELLKGLVALCVDHVGEDLMPEQRAAAQQSEAEAAHAAE